MNFYKEFDTDYIECGRIELPWVKVQQDLASVQHESTRTFPIVKNVADYGDYGKYGYNEHNTNIWKTTSLEPKLTFDWEEIIIGQLPLDHAIATVTRQDPGQVLPWHEDRFFMLRRLYPEDTRPIWRFLMFLEDWKIGHVLQVKDSILTHWKQGDVVVWQPGAMHVSANIGLETKWTCNITGFLTV